jgi:hypothetical protein
MTDELEDRFWRSLLDHLTSAEAEGATREEAQARVAELQRVIDHKRAELQRSLAGMAAIVELAEKEGLPNAAELRADFDRILRTRICSTGSGGRPISSSARRGATRKPFSSP